MVYEIPKIITLEEYAEMARKKGLKNPCLFANFMKTRFPEERHWSYVMEWIQRFKTGSPEGYMDSHSKAIYEKLKKVM